MAETGINAYASEGQGLAELAALLEQVLDNGAPALILRRYDNQGCQALLGNPEGPVANMTRCGAIPDETVRAILRQTVDGLNILVINDETYRFARAEFRIGGGRATVFVPG